MTQPTYRSQRGLLLSTLAAAALAALVLLPLLGHKPVTDWDEGIYAEVSLEMLRGSWWVPHWDQQLWFEKPPLMLWITAALFHSFGISELTARLGSALSGLGIVTLLHLWLERTRNRITACLNTVMLLATFGFLHVCRVGEMDALLSLGCVVSLIGISEVDQEHAFGWYLFWSGAAIAVMTKEAAAAPLFLAALIFSLLQRWTESRFNRAFWVGSALFLAVVVPWHIAMVRGFGHEFSDQYLGLHVLTRATQQIEGHHTKAWFYLKVVLVSAPPFALLYPFAALEALRTGVLRAFAWFALVTLLFYTVVQTRLPHYIAPLYPAFTAVTAAWLARHVEEARRRRPARSFWVSTTAAAVIVCVLAAVVTSRSRASLHTAVLSDGRVMPDNKDAIALLRRAKAGTLAMPGPLLILRRGPAAINAELFYARRPVQQVYIPGEPNSDAFTEQKQDRYINSPVPLAHALEPGPALILLDRDLLAQLPPTVVFTPVDQGREVVLGSIRQVAPPPAPPY